MGKWMLGHWKNKRHFSLHDDVFGHHCFMYYLRIYNLLISKNYEKLLACLLLDSQSTGNINKIHRDLFLSFMLFLLIFMRCLSLIFLSYKSLSITSFCCHTIAVIQASKAHGWNNPCKKGRYLPQEVFQRKKKSKEIGGGSWMFEEGTRGLTHFEVLFAEQTWFFLCLQVYVRFWRKRWLSLKRLSIWMCACSVAKLCLTLWDSLDCSLPASSVHGIS